MSLHQRGRGGFTLIECLVVVGVLGLLMALLIPAVQASREAGRRAQCANNLRQIGVALAGHHASHGRYPAGIRPDGFLGPGRPFGSSPFSAHYQLHPYLDQRPLFDAINASLDLPNASVLPQNATASATALAVFGCPSDQAPLALSPGNHYRACVGALPYCHDASGGGGGAFPGLVAVADRDIRDGTSHTVDFSERLVGTGTGGSFDRRRDSWHSRAIVLDPELDSDEMLAACAALRGEPAEFDPRQGATWLRGELELTLYNHVGPPNGPHSDCSDGGPPSPATGMSGGAVSARSAHPGGVHVLAAMDGSTRFVTDGIAPAVWRAMATRAGAEVVGD